MANLTYSRPYPVAEHRLIEAPGSVSRCHVSFRICLSLVVEALTEQHCVFVTYYDFRHYNTVNSCDHTVILVIPLSRYTTSLVGQYHGFQFMLNGVYTNSKIKYT